MGSVVNWHLVCGLFIKQCIQYTNTSSCTYIAHFRVDSLGGSVWSCNVSSYCLMYTVHSCRWVSECISQSFFFRAVLLHLLLRSPGCHLVTLELPDWLFVGDGQSYSRADGTLLHWQATAVSSHCACPVLYVITLNTENKCYLSILISLLIFFFTSTWIYVYGHEG